MREYTLEFLQKKSSDMFDYLKSPMPSMDDEEKVVDRLMMFGKMLAESGEYKAAAQYKIDVVVHGEIGKELFRIAEERLSASTINLYVKAAAMDWNYLCSAFDRINSAAGKMIMAIQTLISYEKSKMQIR